MYDVQVYYAFSWFTLKKKKVIKVEGFFELAY